jgi:hypothetical protein
MVFVVGAILVFTRGTMAPRTVAAVTDEAVAPITAARKRWDTTTPSAWSNKNKNRNKNKNKNKIIASGGNVTASALADSSPVLPPLLPLRKQRQQWQQHGGSGVAAAAAER